MKFDILTIFPEIINEYCSKSILGRGQKSKAIKIMAHNFRDYSKDKRGHVDDRPFGGGPGMVLQIQPIYDCLKAIKAFPPFQGGTQRGLPSTAASRKGRQPPVAPLSKGGGRTAKTKIIILDPAGKKFDQRLAEKYAKLDRLILICGRYEGFDARIYKLADERVSVGDYVLAGGELPALTVVEAVSRLIPGVLGNVESLKEESHGKSAKEYPQYTRPENFMGQKVPKILLSGNHKLIEHWREKHQK